MTRPHALHREGGFATTPAIVALAGILLLVAGGTVWLALHGPAPAALPAPLPTVSVAPLEPVETPKALYPPMSDRVLDGNARSRLRYAWLAASDYARDHGWSFAGLTPAIAEQRLRHTGNEVTLAGEGPLVFTRFARTGAAAAGVVTIRVADGRTLLLVTRSRTGTAFCFLQRGPETGIGPGDARRVDQCAMRWG
jgi:hypothetical protein